jgi:hypothetical protein
LQPAARVLELTNVTGPWQQGEILCCSGMQNLSLVAEFNSGGIKKVFCQSGDVFAALRQARHMHADDVKTME